MSRSKDVGTRFETGFVRYARAKLGDERPHRSALHGPADEGDVRGIYAHGYEGIAECKCVKAVGPRLLASFREQALAERENADAGFVLLVLHRPGADATGARPSFGTNWAEVTLRDLSRIGMCSYAGSPMDTDEVWVRLSVDDVLALVMGGRDDGEEE